MCTGKKKKVLKPQGWNTSLAMLFLLYAGDFSIWKLFCKSSQKPQVSAIHLQKIKADIYMSAGPEMFFWSCKSMIKLHQLEKVGPASAVFAGFHLHLSRLSCLWLPLPQARKLHFKHHFLCQLWGHWACFVDPHKGVVTEWSAENV